MIPLERPWILLIIPLGILGIWKLVRQKGGIGFSSTVLLEGVRVGPVLILLERVFLSLFLITSVLILAGPIEVVKSSIPVYRESRDIIVVLDISGSMAAGPKLKNAKEVIANFVAGRPQDRIALFSFDTEAYLEWPLSVDHQTLVDRLKLIITGGGTKIAVGIIAALDHQRQFGQKRGAVILVSDGASNVTPEEKAAIESSLGRTKLYWVQIGDDTEERILAFGEYVKSLGGKVYRGESDELEEIFSEISLLESSPVVWEQRVTTVYRFGLLPLTAFLSLLAAAGIELLREV